VLLYLPAAISAAICAMVWILHPTYTSSRQQQQAAGRKKGGPLSYLVYLMILLI
jgi:hypothetical protein